MTSRWDGMAALGRLTLRPLRTVDRQDVVTFGGLLLMAAGLARLSGPWACIIVGALLFALGLVGALRRAG